MPTKNPASNASPETFEQVVALAQSSSNFKPLWNRLVKTKFFVAIVPDSTSSNTDFILHQWPADEGAQASIHISEYKEKIKLIEGAELTRLSGAEIVRRAANAVGIRLLLEKGPLEVAAVRVDWLKRSLEASREALLKKQAAKEAAELEVKKSGDTLPPINAISIPAESDEPAAVKAWDFRVSALPAEVQAGSSEKSNSSDTGPSTSINFQALELESIKPVVKAAATFDLASLKSRHVTHAGLGLELFVPQAWQEIRNEKAMKFLEPEMHLVVEINGRRRDEMSLDSWMEMRIPLVTQEMPGLVAKGSAVEFTGRNWGSQMSGKMLEFRGRLLGEDVDSIYQIYCVQTAKHLFAVCIRAPENVFEAQRALFKWMTEGIEAYEMPAKHGAANGASDGIVYEPVLNAPAPAFFSLSFTGRLGRLRFIVYSMMTALAFGVLIGLTAYLVKEPSFVIMATILVLYVIMIYRPVVLRMHDFNLSGKWLLLLFLAVGITVVVKSAALSLILGLFYLVFWGGVLLLPGNSGVNEYGSPCPPNTRFISVTAWILIALTVLGGVFSYKAVRNQVGMFSKAKASVVQSGYGFTPVNNSFSINFPVLPKEEVEAVAKAKLPGIDDAHVYHAAFDGFEYYVQEIAFARTPPDKSVAANQFASAFSGRLGGEILDSTKTMLGDYPAEAVKMRLPSGAQQDFRFFFVGNKFYVLGVQSPKGREKSLDADSFFDSFQAH